MMARWPGPNIDPRSTRDHFFRRDPNLSAEKCRIKDYDKQITDPTTSRLWFAACGAPNSILFHIIATGDADLVGSVFLLEEKKCDISF